MHLLIGSDYTVRADCYRGIIKCRVRSILQFFRHTKNNVDSVFFRDLRNRPAGWSADLFRCPNLFFLGDVVIYIVVIPKKAHFRK